MYAGQALSVLPRNHYRQLRFRHLRGGGSATTLTGNTPKDLTCVAGGIAAEDNGQAPNVGTKSCPNLYGLTPRKHKNK